MAISASETPTLGTSERNELHAMVPPVRPVDGADAVRNYLMSAAAKPSTPAKGSNSSRPI